MRLAFAYGFTSKLFVINEVKEYTIIKNDKKYKQPILYSDYIIAPILSGCYCIYFMPIYLFNDIRNTEIKYKYEVFEKEYRNFYDLVFDYNTYKYKNDLY
jgi:hypothetical protein